MWVFRGAQYFILDYGSFNTPAFKNIPDSKIAKDLALARTKSTAIVTNVIAPSYNKHTLTAILKTSKFSILTDESTDIAVSKSACIVVRYFDESEKKIVTSLWELISVFEDGDKDQAQIRQGTAEHLFKIIMETFDRANVPSKNIIGFSSDGCNMMMGQYN